MPTESIYVDPDGRWIPVEMFGFSDPQRNVILRKVRLFRARQKGTHTVSQWNALIARRTHCPRCGNEVSAFEKDHIVPIYQGGSDSIDNIQPLCTRCNRAKGSECIRHPG